MAGTVEFNKENVRKLVDHALAHPLMSPTFTHLSEKKYWKKDTVPGEHGWAKAEDVDASKIEPYLMLVKDSGIYLMSGSATPLPGTETLNHVVYAEGLDENADWDEVRRIAGGDDFGEPLPLSWFVQAIEFPGDTFKISISAKSIRLIQPTPAALKKAKP